METRENLESGAILLGVGVAAWLLYQVFQQIKAPAAAVNSAYQATTQAIANLFPGTSATVVPQGSVLLPSGSTVPVSSLSSAGFNADGTLAMTDGVNTYNVSSGATPGTYVAEYSGLGGLRRRGGLR